MVDALVLAAQYHLWRLEALQVIVKRAIVDLLAPLEVAEIESKWLKVQVKMIRIDIVVNKALRMEWSYRIESLLEQVYTDLLVPLRVANVYFKSRELVVQCSECIPKAVTDVKCFDEQFIGLIDEWPYTQMS